VTKRRYNYERKHDAETIRFMKAAARAEGLTYGEWCHKYGIMSEWDEKKANREKLESELGPRTMGAIVSRLSTEDWEGATPGGDQMGSILIDRRAPVKPPKRPRGRPRKNFVRVEDARDR